MFITIEQLRLIAANSDKVIITSHSALRFRESKIYYDDIISAINSGEIIEEYPNDYPYPSCLILGLTVSNTSVHVVCGTEGNHLWIISAYFPSTDKWTSDFKTRKN